MQSLHRWGHHINRDLACISSTRRCRRTDTPVIQDRPATLTCIRRQRVSNRSMMVALTFPDGARRDFPNGSTGLDIAKGISPSLAKRTVAMALDGVLTDLGDPIEHDAKIEFISRDHPGAHPARRCPRARPGPYKPVARHASHHRAGD